MIVSKSTQQPWLRNPIYLRRISAFFLIVYVSLILLKPLYQWGQYLLASYEEGQLKKLYYGEFPQLIHAKPLTIARTLRNEIYQHTTLGDQDLSLPLTLGQLTDIRRGQYRLSPAGIAAHYAAVLNLFGVQTRMIYLQSQYAYDTGSLRGSHVAVEVLIEKSYILEDPVFNIEWHMDGRPLSARELQKMFHLTTDFLEGPQPNTNRFPVSSARHIRSYFISYDQLMAHLDITRLNLWSPDLGQYCIVASYPDSMSWRYRIEDSGLPNHVPYHDLLCKYRKN